MILFNKSIRLGPKAITALIIFSALVFNSCSDKKFKIFSDPSYHNEVQKRFEARKELAAGRYDDLFKVFEDELTEAEIQGLKFLFAYMPLSDLADYNGEFFLKHVRASLEARDSMPWGDMIPETEFRHFVLPYRVNNENLDTARMVFYNELKERIRHLDMLEAALEVNHWCHEKVTYKGTDIRTSAPLATVKAAFGRCGEESTFTVAALRSVAIPARQVYTPRWAHSDDNHAWVEFWADGEWHYMGACEPEPVANYGWFTEPARRAMLVHTKAFGDYRGPEWVSVRDNNYSLLNTLSVYAPVKEFFVRVLDRDGIAVNGAEVEFQLYNYAEFYPIVTKSSDQNGLCSFLTGLGDLQVWAHDGQAFNYRKISVADTDTLILTLNQAPYENKVEMYDLIPPIEREPYQVSMEGKELNSKRLKEEDSIRSAYEATFMQETEAFELADKMEIDRESIARFIKLSRGNYDEIENFLVHIPDEMRELGITLLGQVSEKDLRDTRAYILKDHLLGAAKYSNSTKFTEEIYQNYVLNPRVATEMLAAYRDYFQNSFSSEQIMSFKNNPQNIIAWITDSIKLNEKDNYYQTALTPVGVLGLRTADEFSLRIFSVALLRTFGFPARLEPGTGYVQYYAGGDWLSVTYDKDPGFEIPRGMLVLKNDPSNPIEPKYHIHFTIAQFREGKYHTLDYEWDMPVSDFSGGLSLDEGNYMLITGNRIPGGAVLHSQEFFLIKEGQTVTKTVSLRTSDKEPETLARLDLEAEFNTTDNESIKLSAIAGEGWSVIAWIDPGKEPGKHTFHDLGILKKELDGLGLPFIFIIPSEKLTESFKNSDYSNLPSKKYFLIDGDLSLLKKIEEQVNKSLRSHLPVILICNSQGDVIYLSSGYKIGIGEEIVKAVK